MAGTYEFENGLVAEILEPINGHDAVRIWSGDVLVSGVCRECGFLVAAEDLVQGLRFGLVSHPVCEGCMVAKRRAYWREFRRVNYEAELARSRDKYQRFRDQHIATVQKYREENYDLIIERRRRWFDENRDAHNEKRRAYAKTPEGRAAAVLRNSRRRQSIKGNECTCLTPAALSAVWGADEGLCVYCGLAAEHFDHVLPLALGGKHCVENMRPACARCNWSKHAKLLTEWLPVAPYATEPLPTTLTCPNQASAEAA